ncbi:TatD family hydrolase [Cupriavidus basilensis]
MIAHCHADRHRIAISTCSAEYRLPTGAGVADAAQAVGVTSIVVPAVAVWNFDTVRTLARQDSRCVYALGIHPLCSPGAAQPDVDALRREVAASIGDPRFVGGIGEIGLELLPSPKPRCGPPGPRLYIEQLKIAREFDLPVLLHVRRSQDQVCAQLRKLGVRQGIAHAFNGSHEQARRFH